MTKSKKPKSVLLILLTVAGGILGFLLGKYGLTAVISLPDNIGIAMIFLIIPIFFFVIAFHEAGHALAGVLVRFDFKMYVVGPFLWEKASNRWNFKWNKNVNTAGGLVVCLPTGEDNLKARFVWYAAGGPIASLLLAVIAFVVYYFIHDASPVTGSVLMVMSFFSLLIFISTAIPLQGGGFASDGARVKKLLQGGDSARFEILMIKVIASSASGTRPRDLDKAELEETLSLAKKLKASFEVYVHAFLYQAAFDNNDLDQAELYLKEYINKADDVPAGIRNAVWLDGAFFYAAGRKDILKANEYWSQFKPAALIPKAQVHAVEAAIAYLNNDVEKGKLKKEEAMKELPNMIDRGAAVSLEEKLSLL